jgi:hypothetical protein
MCKAQSSRIDYATIAANTAAKHNLLAVATHEEQRGHAQWRINASVTISHNVRQS